MSARWIAAGVSLLLAGPALGQVTVNPQALPPVSDDKSSPQPASPTPSNHRPAKSPSANPPSAHPPAAHSPAAHATPSHQPPSRTVTPPRPPPVIVPPAPPPAAVLQPLVPPPPPHPTDAPPPVPVVPDAAGTVTEIPTGLRVTFGAASADVNAASNEAIRRLAKASPDGNFSITAFASGVPDDPSTPRRLSLSRALAARSLLIAEGIPSIHINVRALGPNSAEGPADRVDITVTMPPTAKP